VKTLKSIRGSRSYPARPPLSWRSLETAAGFVSFAVDDAAVREVRLGHRHAATGPSTRLLERTERQLAEYLAGQRETFDLPFTLELPRFTRDVLTAVARIPFGRTLSYGEVAGAVGNPRASRAVGQAVGANPLPLLIPCHRVLAARDGLGGFGGGLRWKRFLLRLEGVTWRERASRA